MTRRSLLATTLLLVCMCGGGPLRETSFAQRASVPKQPDKAVIATENVKELLAVMDTDKNRKISKQEWMKFMEAEFDKLDAANKGEIDPRELLQSTVSIRPPRAADLGK